MLQHIIKIKILFFRNYVSFLFNFLDFFIECIDILMNYDKVEFFESLSFFLKNKFI